MLGADSFARIQKELTDFLEETNRYWIARAPGPGFVTPPRPAARNVCGSRAAGSGHDQGLGAAFQQNSL